jgi:hypothetical protein
MSNRIYFLETEWGRKTNLRLFANNSFLDQASGYIVKMWAYKQSLSWSFFVLVMFWVCSTLVHQMSPDCSLTFRLQPALTAFPSPVCSCPSSHLQLIPQSLSPQLYWFTSFVPCRFLVFCHVPRGSVVLFLPVHGAEIVSGFIRALFVLSWVVCVCQSPSSLRLQIGASGDMIGRNKYEGRFVLVCCQTLGIHLTSCLGDIGLWSHD